METRSQTKEHLELLRELTIHSQEIAEQDGLPKKAAFYGEFTVLIEKVKQGELPYSAIREYKESADYW